MSRSCSTFVIAGLEHLGIHCYGNGSRLNLKIIIKNIYIYILGTWPFSCRGTSSRATGAVPLGVGIHTHVSTQYICFFLIVVYRLSHWHASFHTHTFWLYMVHSASNAKTHWHSFVLLHASALHSALLHQSRKQNGLAHWTCCIFLVYILFSQNVCYHWNRTYWHGLMVFQIP